MSIFTPQVSTPILIAGSEKIILHFSTLSVKIHFEIILELFLSKKGKQIVRARSTHLFLSINNMSRIFEQRYYRVESTLRSGLAQKVSYISEQSTLQISSRNDNPPSLFLKYLSLQSAPALKSPQFITEISS